MRHVRLWFSGRSIRRHRSCAGFYRFRCSSWRVGRCSACKYRASQSDGGVAVSVRVPATSANLGPGFDVLGLALSLYVEVGIIGTDATPSEAIEANDTHPAQIAFVRAGGSGRVWVKNDIPMGRGMGFSGAVRIAGVVAAEVQRDGTWHRDSSDALSIGTELEGHADNVAPSLHGGIVITSENIVVQVPLALDPAFVMWIPEFT
ncbi:MAG: hypothetical protein F2595_01575, partial [Actinobacteria bacterium]|nr:hypothetical protein [Actinomycetota bacterium]